MTSAEKIRPEFQKIGDEEREKEKSKSTNNTCFSLSCLFCTAAKPSESINETTELVPPDQKNIKNETAKGRLDLGAIVYFAIFGGVQRVQSILTNIFYL